jgi:hypothetical protein
MSLFLSARRRVATAFALVSGWVASGSALAQVPPSVVITFDSGATSVPVGGLASWGLGLALAGLAMWFARRNSAGRAALLVIAASSVIATAALNMPSAIAGAPSYQVNLVSSPSTVIFGSAPLGTNQYVMEFRNAVAGPITIRSVQMLNGLGLSINPVGTTCVPNLVLAPNTTCIVALAERGG